MSSQRSSVLFEDIADAIDLENADPANSSNSADQNNSNSSQTQQRDSLFRQKGFDLLYHRKWNNQGTSVLTCKFCPKEMTTNRQKIWAQHSANCDKAPTRLKQLATDILAELSNSRLLEVPRVQDRDIIELIKTFLDHNVPMALFNDKRFKNLMMKKGLVLPDRCIVSSKYLNFMANQADKSFFNKISSMPVHSISVEFDHWTDFCNVSLLAILASFSFGDKHLVSLIDVSLLSHGADDTKNSIVQALKGIPAEKINSLISDSASACRLAKDKVVEIDQYSHLIQHRCLAHYINLIGNGITEEAEFKEIISAANIISRHVNTNIRIAAHLRNAGIKKVTRSTKTRWFTIVSMLETLLINRDDLIRIMQRLRSYDTAILTQLQDEPYWQRVFNLLKVLKPLNEAVATAESSEGSIGMAMKHLLEFSRALFKADWADPCILTAVKSFLTYFSRQKLTERELGIMLAAYCLERRYNRNYLTAEAEILVFKTLVSIADLSKHSEASIDEFLEPEFDKFCAQEAEYGAKQEEDQLASEWWQLRSRSILSSVAIRLTSLRSSSAAVERLFSMLKQIQSPNRTNYSLDTLERIGKVKLAVMCENLAENSLNEEPNLFDSSQPLMASQKRRRVPDSMSLESLKFADEVNSPKLDLLTALELRNSYFEFRELVDFDIINAMKYPSSALSARSTNLNETIERFKAKKRNS